MNGKKARALRRLAREQATSDDTTVMVRRYHHKQHDTHFWAAGTMRRIYQDLKNAS